MSHTKTALSKERGLLSDFLFLSFLMQAVADEADVQRDVDIELLHLS